MTESRRLAAPAYAVAAALVAVPIADILVSLNPWRLMEPRWRFGAVGLVSNALLLPILGLLIALAASVFLDHRTMRRVVGWLSVVAAVVCAVVLVVFCLDALQTRADVRPEMRTSFTTAALSAGLKTTLATIVLGVLGVAALRRPRVKAAVSSEVPLFTAREGMLKP